MVGAAGTATTPLKEAEIVPDADMRRLETWLQAHSSAPVKFIVSPSVVLPAWQPGDAQIEERLGLDSWSGYPRSLIRLLAMIETAGGNGVVLLSGDAHFSMACKLMFKSGRVVHAVVSSGMYAPWLFANGRREDDVLEGPLKLECDGAVAEGTMMQSSLCTQAGYAAVTFLPPAGGGCREGAKNALSRRFSCHGRLPCGKIKAPQPTPPKRARASEHVSLGGVRGVVPG